MLHILTRNWKAKIVCVLIATVLWYIINQNVTQRNARPDWPTPAASFQ